MIFFTFYILIFIFFFKVPDIIEDSNETASAIFENLKQCVNKFNLSVENLVSYSADNANVNFGVRNSVYKKFQDENSAIVKANCSPHIIHNTCKYASDMLDVDIETVILKLTVIFLLQQREGQS